jgi:hypothetical protein
MCSALNKLPMLQLIAVEIEYREQLKPNFHSPSLRASASRSLSQGASQLFLCDSELSERKCSFIICSFNSVGIYEYIVCIELSSA